MPPVIDVQQISFSARICCKFFCLESKVVLGASIILRASESAFHYVLAGLIVYKENIYIETGTYDALLRSLPSSEVHSFSDNGKEFNFQKFLEQVAGLCRSISNHQLVSSFFVVGETGDGGKTGQLAHLLKFSGQQNGSRVIATVVAVVQIG